MKAYDNLGKSFQIGNLTIKNRFCMAPLRGSPHHLPEGELTDTTIQYFVERVKGEV